MRAVVLIVILANLALQASPDLSTHANAVADLDSLNLGADFDGVADDLVANTDGKWCLAPASVDGVHIATADAAAFDLDVDIVVAELLGGELAWLAGIRDGLKARRNTSCFLNSVHFFWSLIMNPSKVSG